MCIAGIFIEENDMNFTPEALSGLPQDVYQFALPTWHTVAMFMAYAT
jgi:hypothetical protein